MNADAKLTYFVFQGIRRVIALTGPEAAKARQKAKLLENRCEGVRVTVTAEAKGLPQKELVRIITELNDDISQATISHWKKDELRTRYDLFCLSLIWKSGPTGN